MTQTDFFSETVAKPATKKPKVVKNNAFTIHEKRAIIKGLLKEGANIDWPIEMRSLNILYKRYPNRDFWLKFGIKFKLNSLRWLMGEGRAEIAKQFTLFNLDCTPKEQTVIGDSKVGEDYVSEAKIDLKSFLK